MLSTDGGFTYPFVLASDVPNDGSHNVIVPDVGGDTLTARVKVEGHNNIFYAINPVNFSVRESLSVNEFDEDDTTLNVYPNPNDGAFNVVLDNSVTDNFDISVYDIRGRKVFEKKYTNSASRFTESIDLGYAESGVYLLVIKNDIINLTRKILIR